jgi:hypothetical protein
MSKAEHHHHSDGQPDYTDKDIRVKPLLIFILICMAAMFITMFGMNALMHKLNDDVVKTDSFVNVYSQESQRPENGPLLQPMNEAAIDLKKLHAHENELLTKYEWIDKQAGTVRIPIDQAIEKALARGYPVREVSATK